MNTIAWFRRMVALVAVPLAGSATTVLAQAPLTGAFTYQGELRDGGSPAEGPHDLRFSLFDSAGAPVGSTLCADNVPVQGGRFVVTLDFGVRFDGARRFLEVGVRRDTGLSCGNPTGFVVLSPRQELTAAPHAAFALGAQTAASSASAANATRLNGQLASFYTDASNLNAGTIPDARLAPTVARTNVAQTFTGAMNFTNSANVFAGSGAGLTGLNASNISGGTLDSARLQQALLDRIPRESGVLSVIAGAPTHDAPYSVAILGNHAYVGNYQGDGSLQVFDISNPRNPLQLGSVQTGSATAAVTVLPHPLGDRVFLFNVFLRTLKIYNVGNPSSPTLLGSAAIPGQPAGMAVSPTHAFIVTDPGNSLQVFDVTIPGSPTLVGSAPTAAGPRRVALSGNHAFVVNSGADTLQVFDISNPAAPVSVGSAPTGDQPVDVAVVGSTAYVINSIGATLQTFDVSTPTSPAPLGSVATGATPVALAVQSPNAYVALSTANSVQCFDVTIPASPSLRSSVATDAAPRGLAAAPFGAAVVNSDADTIQFLEPGTGLVHSPLLAAAGGFSGDGSRLSNLNAANVTGKLADQRLSSNVALLGSAQTFTGVPSFNGGTSGSSAPFRVDSTFKVTNLNADLLDGLDSAEFLRSTPPIRVSADLQGTVVRFDNTVVGTSPELTALTVSGHRDNWGPALRVLRTSPINSYFSGGAARGGAILASSHAGVGLAAHTADRGSAAVYAFNHAEVGTGDATAVFAGMDPAASGAAAAVRASVSGATHRAIDASSQHSLGYAGYFAGGRNYFQGKVGIGVEPAGSAMLEVSGVVTASSIGIRTASPVADLHVRGNGTGARVVVDPGASDTDVEMGLYENTSNSLGVILRYASSASNQFRVVGVNSGPTEVVLAQFDRDSNGGAGGVHIPVAFSSATKYFRIDHPLDPLNKELRHSSVESPDMKNLYDGTVELDGEGRARVTLPDYFEALNQDFRYQLTCVGGWAPVYIEREIEGNSFGIAGGSPGLKVSWQVTGVRKDPAAVHHRLEVEAEKEPEDRGRYLNPGAYAPPTPGLKATSAR